MSGATRAPRRRWTPEEIATLEAHYPLEGAESCKARFPGREQDAIRQRAATLGLKDPTLGLPAAKRKTITGSNLARVLKLRGEGWGCARIGKEIGFCEATVANAVHAAECRRLGHTPARRDSNGGIIARDIKRLHAMLMEGLRGVEIQQRLGISASVISYHRRRLKAELTAKRKGNTLPPPGRGEDYTGRRFAPDVKREVERLFMEGLGAKKVSERTGVSNTQVGRIRNKLIKRLARKGQCLPGCDKKGRRFKQAESTRWIQPVMIEALRQHLLERVPVKRAAALVGIGACSAYRIRDALAAELAAAGGSLPKPLLVGKSKAGIRAARDANWLPPGHLFRYRTLCLEMPSEQAKAKILAEAAEAKRTEAARPLTFEEQLERVRNGAPIARVMTFRPVMPDRTLGGIGSAAL